MRIWFGEAERVLPFAGSELSRMACALTSCGNKRNSRKAKEKAISTSRWTTALQDICLLRSICAIQFSQSDYSSSFLLPHCLRQFIVLKVGGWYGSLWLPYPPPIRTQASHHRWRGDLSSDIICGLHNCRERLGWSIQGLWCRLACCRRLQGPRKDSQQSRAEQHCDTQDWLPAQHPTPFPGLPPSPCLQPFPLALGNPSPV